MFFFLCAPYYVMVATALPADFDRRIHGSPNLTEKIVQDAKIIGARFRSARSLVPNLNRKMFCEKYDINRYTMQSWENGLHVSKGKNIEKFIEALAKEGVVCTSSWLIEGKGEPARTLYTNSSTALNPKNSPLPEFLTAKTGQDPKFIEQLLSLSQNLGLDLVAHRVSDDAMAPKFLSGEVVLGQKISFVKDLAHQKYCIIKLNPEHMILRKVLVTKDGLLLMALDERMPTIPLRFENEVYQVIWHCLNQ
jgi:hypothetical protein